MHRLATLSLATILLLAHGQAHAEAPPERLSGAGETCSRTADCMAPLRCVASYCQVPGKKSGAGESCRSSGDCAAPLGCVADVCRGASPVGSMAPQASSSRTAAYVTLGVGGALLVTGVGLLAGGAAADADFDDKLAQVNCTAEPPLCKSFNERVQIAADAAALEEQRDDFYIAGAVLTSVGVAGIIVGAVLMAKRSGGPPPVAQVTPWIDAGGNGSTLGANAVVTF